MNNSENGDSYEASEESNPPDSAPDSAPESAPESAPDSAPDSAPESAPDNPEPDPADFVVAFARGVVPTKWFRAWNERYPSITLGSFRTDSVDQIEALRAGRANMSIVRDPADTDGLNLIALYREIAVVIAPKEHEIQLLEQLSPHDLRAIPLLENPDAPADWPQPTVSTAPTTLDLASHESTHEDTIGSTYRSTIEDTIELVAAGLGLLIVPQSIARLHARSDLIYRPLIGVSDTQVSLAWRQDDESQEVQDFIGVVRGRTARSSRGQAAAEPAPAPKKKKAPAAPKKKAGPRPFGTSRRPGGQKGRRR